MIFKDNPPVITGMGVATPVGMHLASFQNSLERGRSGLRFIDAFDVRALPIKKAFTITEPVCEDDGERDRYILLALHAAKAAVQDSGLSSEKLSAARSAAFVSSSKGGLGFLEKKMRELFAAGRQAEEATFPFLQKIATDGAASEVHRHLNLSGFTQNAVSACATGLHAIMLAALALAAGDAEVAIAGAADASITPLALGAYHNMKLYSHDNMRPFDKRRSGFIIGEGAGILTLEPETAARARGARVYAKIRGFLMAQDVGGMCAHDPKAGVLAGAIERLLRAADLSARQIDYVCLHGTSTLAGDAYEASQCCLAFGDAREHISFNAPKSMFGHLLGAAGAVEAIVTALSVFSDTVYPTINSEQTEKALGLNINFNRLTRKPIQYALKISMGFGGHVAVLLLEK